MSLPWTDDSRSIAWADATYTYEVSQNAGTSTFTAVRSTRYGFALESKTLGTAYPDLVSAKTACETDYLNPQP